MLNLILPWSPLLPLAQALVRPSIMDICLRTIIRIFHKQTRTIKDNDRTRTTNQNQNLPYFQICWQFCQIFDYQIRRRSTKHIFVTFRNWETNWINHRNAKICKKVKKNKTLLVETSRRSQTENLLKMKKFFNLKVTVSEHRILNTSKGIIKDRALKGESEKDICDYLKNQGVIAVKRFTIKKEFDTIETNTLLLTFNSVSVPKSVNIFLQNYICRHICTESSEVLQLSEVWSSWKWLSSRLRFNLWKVWRRWFYSPSKCMPKPS